MRNSKILISLAAAILLSACESEPLENLQQSIVETTPATDGDINPTALFDPNNAIIPFPNGLLLSGSTDGTLNIPVADANDLSDPQVALNAIDGFSTLAPMTTGFSTAIDASSISSTSVKVYNVNLSGPGGAVVGINSQLTFGVDYIATLSSVDSTNSTLTIVPLQPLAEKSSYMVVVTSNLSAASGSAFGPSVTLRLIKSLTDPAPLVPCSSPTDPTCTLPGALRSLDTAGLARFDGLRQLVNTSESTISAFDPADNVTASSIIVSWSFTTQSVGDVLEQVRTDIRAAAVPTTALQDSTVDSPLTGQTGFVGADIFAGTLAIPYYLTAASGVNDPTPLATFWTGAGGSPLGGNILPSPVLSPVVTSTQTIPLLVSVPKTAAPGAGYPIVIYQHGITTNRATMLAIADAFANAGLAVAAIDLPLHGLTGLETDGTAGFRIPGAERTFDLNLVTQDPSGSITAATPDNVIDSSGRHFINLTNLLNTRDNVRQGVSDLMALTYAIQSMNAGGATFDTNRIYFLGHSLGAIVGSTFVALESDVRDAAFAFGAGSVAKTLDGSAAFGPEIAAGLAANGVTKGTADFESFLGAAQTVVDTADPANHATATATGRGILYFEIVGGGPGQSPSDLVVPNTVPDGNDTSGTVAAPLAGTEPLLALMGLTQVNSDQGPGADLKHSVKFLVGNHSSLLSAAADSFNDAATNALVRTEIQTLAATFLASDGAVVDVTDASLLQAP